MSTRLPLSFLFSALIALVPALSHAGASKDDAVKFVKNAVEFYKKNGKEKSLAEFSKQEENEFKKGELYLTVWDTKGTQIAHGANPKLIGKQLLDLKDADGKEFVKEFMKIDNKGGWVNYKWTNPTNKKIEKKTVYLEKVDDTIIGAGIYSE